MSENGDEMKISESPPRELMVTVAIALFVVSFLLVCHGISLIRSGLTFRGIQFLGLSEMTLGGGFDAINCLWLWLPFTFKSVMKPVRFARFG